MGRIANDPDPAYPDVRAIEAELFGDAPAPAPAARWLPGPGPAPAPYARSDVPVRPVPSPDYAAAVAARAAADASAAAAVAARGQLERFLTRGEPLAPVAGPPEPLVAPATPSPRAAPTEGGVPTLVSDLAPDAALPPAPTPVPEPLVRARRRPLGRPERPLDPALEEIYFASVPLDDPDAGRRPAVRRAGAVAERRSRWRLRLSFRRGGAGG